MISIFFNLVHTDKNGQSRVDATHVATGPNISKFEMYNKLNNRLYGSFTMLDYDQHYLNELNIHSDIDGFIILNGSASTIGEDSGNGSESSVINIVIKHIEQTEIRGNNSMLKFYFVGGRFSDEIRKTDAFEGSSIQAMEATLQSRGAPFEHGNTKIARYTGTDSGILSTADVPSQVGAWYSMSSDLFSTLDYISSHSLRFNDYVFWVYDDILSKYVISSFQQQFSASDRYYILRGTDIPDPGVILPSDSNIKIVMPSSFNIESTYGENSDKLFPNVAYTIGYGANIRTSLIDFKTYMKDLRGVDINVNNNNSVLFSDVLNIDIPVYGNRRVKQMSSNNTHKLHAFAEDYRDYKLATFSKKINLVFYKFFGLPLGEYVTFFNRSTSGMSEGSGRLDSRVTDRYITYSKHIVYDGETDSVTTDMQLISDNKGQIYDELREKYKLINNILSK